jgi:hypothetical protein
MKTRLLLLVFVLPVSCAPVSAYRDLPRVRAWESTIGQFEELDRTTTYPDDAVLFAGSSSIRLWDSLVEGYRLWTKIIRHELDGVLRIP